MMIVHGDVEGIYYIEERELLVKCCPEKSEVFVHKKGGDGGVTINNQTQFICDSTYQPSGRRAIMTTGQDT